ncbi:MAG: FAD-dependent oxidoreductase [Pseudomonadota bacterium]
MGEQLLTHSNIAHPDILIIGGGSAGIAAAVGAAETGASVVLLEKNAVLGGKATAAYVSTICGLYYRNDDPVVRYAVGGFPHVFAEKLQVLSNSCPFFYKNGLRFLPYDHFAFIQLCDEVVQQNNVTLYLYAHLIQIEKDNHRIQKVSAIIHNRPITFQPKVVIDSTGESAVSRFAGVDTVESETYQAAAQTFIMTDIATNDEQKLRLSLLRSVRKGIEDGLYPKHYEMLSVIPGSLKLSRAVFKLGLPLEVGNDLSEITRLQLFARKAVTDIVNYLKTHNNLFRNALLSMIAPEVGIRTGPCNVGKAVLQKEDVMNCRKVQDAVARGTWPIEFWIPGKKLCLEYFALNDHYDIPGRALQSATVTNLLFAGRNISASEEALASARVIGTCLATGYAAGHLAAGVINNESYEGTIATVQRLLFFE